MAGRYVLSSGAACTLGEHLRGMGGSCLLPCDRHPSEDLLARMADGIRLGSDVKSVEVRRLERPKCEKPRARELAASIKASGATVVVALGSSKVLDLSRAAMKPLQPERPALVLVPSIVSSNACVGSLAVMYDEEGRVNGFWQLDRAPELVAVDLDFVVGADPRFLAAAMGDQLASSLEALHACALRGQGGAGPAAHAAALDALLVGGRVTLDALKAHEAAPLLELVVRAVTHYTPAQEAASGVVLCHALGEALSVDPDVRGRMHGEVVGACVRAELVAAGERDAVGEWVRFLHGVGLPASLAELGVRDISESRVLGLCEQALAGMMGEGSARRWTADEMAVAVLEAESLVA